MKVQVKDKDVVDAISNLQTRMYGAEHKASYPKREEMTFQKEPNREMRVRNDYDYFKMETSDVVRMILDHLGLEMNFKSESISLGKKGE